MGSSRRAMGVRRGNGRSYRATKSEGLLQSMLLGTGRRAGGTDLPPHSSYVGVELGMRDCGEEEAESECADSLCADGLDVERKPPSQLAIGVEYVECSWK